MQHPVGEVNLRTAGEREGNNLNGLNDFRTEITLNDFRTEISLSDFRTEISLNDFRTEISLNDFRTEISLNDFRIQTSSLLAAGARTRPTASSPRIRYNPNPIPYSLTPDTLLLTTLYRILNTLYPFPSNPNTLTL